MNTHYDYVIIGAGVAGCVLAARLTENPNTRVLLIEAGKDTPPGKEPEDILDNYPTSYYNKSYIWPNFKVSWRKAENGMSNFPQGKIMGGGGSLMGMVSLRGTPADYAEWVNCGAKNWAWEDVLPYFKKLETDIDFSNEMHGTSGPIPIRRLSKEQWPPLTKAIAKYSEQHNIPLIGDPNADFRDGYGSTPICNTPHQRASTALRYITPQVRQRTNLTMVHETQVEKILFDGTRATGVLAKNPSGEITYQGNEILVSSGGIFSPALLMRSGIGDASLLQNLQIPVVANRPGVGQNLQNHPILFIGFHLKKNARQDSSLRTHPSASLRYSSQLPDCPPGDLYVNVQSKTSWNAMGLQIGNLAPCVLRPKSTGHVTIQSPHSKDHPITEFNFLSDPADITRMMMAFTKAVEILADSEIKRMMGKPFPVRFSDRLRQLNEYNTQNFTKANRLATLLNILPGISDFVLSRLTGDAIDLDALIKNPQDLAQHVQKNIAGMFHPVGSCRMGDSEDPMAVVDSTGKVYGVQNLRVVDASIMPNLIAGNTNIPTIMVAEKIADELVKNSSN